MRTRKLSLAGLLLACLLATAIAAPSASAEEWGIQAENFGIEAFDGRYEDQNGNPFTQAGGHPYAVTTQIVFNHHPDTTPGFVGAPTPNGQPKNVEVTLPAGFLGSTTVAGQCTATELEEAAPPAIPPNCPVSSLVGTIAIHNNGIGAQKDPYHAGIFNMVPPVGVAARFGFEYDSVPVYLDARVQEDGQVTVSSADTSQAVRAWGVETTFWGVPADARHDSQRCDGSPFCDPEATNPAFQSHHAGVPPTALLTMPTSCPPAEVGLETKMRMDSWAFPGVFHEASFLSHQPPYLPTFVAGDSPPPAGFPGPQVGTTGCDLVPSNPKLTTVPTSQSAASPTGLDAELKVPTEGLLAPEGVSQSALKKVTVTLPEGMSLNPSQGEGLGACSPADLSRETATSAPGEGCPSTSKIGTVEVKTPLLDHPIPGSVYLAKPYENPFNSLLAIYIVLKDPISGISIKLAGKVEGDPTTGQITTTFDDLPQVAISSFHLHFREGARSPLATPQTCGTYTTQVSYVPYSDPSKVIHDSSPFQITSGASGAPCPPGGTPPFHPGLQAGSINNAAGHYSPFYVRLTRNDPEQEITHFSIKLPPGIIGKLAGIPFCPDAAIEAAKLKTGGEEEEHPSCPKASEVGHTLVGSGVGGTLVYAPGKVYLAGPYHGSALSVASITSAKVGPFDLGTVVVRVALKVNPETAEVFVDATGSDPIPHIIDGVQTHLRDIRVYMDRPEFVINPTGCQRTSTASTVLGSGLNFGSEADDQPITVSTPFQAADCAALPFKPKLKLSLIGGTRRGAHPRFRAELRMKPGESNIARSQVTLPHSEFLANAHIKTICTRVQFVQSACPAQSVYGYAQATTPILSEPLQGPVYLRSSEHKLPDLVAELKNGEITIDLVGRIDSVEGGRIRNTFEAVPDAPVSRFVLTMQGAGKGLLENSTNLCKGTHKAIVDFTAHNGKVADSNTALSANCAKSHKKPRKAKGQGGR